MNRFSPPKDPEDRWSENFIILGAIITFLVGLAVGAAALLNPFIPSLSDLLKSHSLYDFTYLAGFWLAILMSLTGITLIYRVTRGLISAAPLIDWIARIVVIAILVALIIGRFI